MDNAKTFRLSANVLPVVLQNRATDLANVKFLSMHLLQIANKICELTIGRIEVGCCLGNQKCIGDPVLG